MGYAAAGTSQPAPQPAMTLAQFQTAIALDLQTAILNKVTTVNPTFSGTKGPVQTNRSQGGDTVIAYASNPNSIGGDAGNYGMNSAFFQNAPFSGSYTESNAQEAANNLYNAYLAEETGYSLLVQHYKQSHFIGEALTVNGVTYSFRGISGNNPQRVGFYDELSNNYLGHYHGGVFKVDVYISGGKIYSLLSFGN